MKMFKKSKKAEKIVYETIEKVKDKKLSPAERKKIAKGIVDDLGRNPEERKEILIDVIGQLYEEGVELPEEIKIKLSTAVIQEVSESDKMPEGSTVKATEVIADKLPDNAAIELAQNVALGIEGKNKILEMAVSDEEKKIEEKLNLLYENVEDIARDTDVVNRIQGIIGNKEEKTKKAEQIINKIVAKKIMQNYLKYNSTMITTFSGIELPEDMLKNDIPYLAKCEYRKLPTQEREKYKKEYKEEVFKEKLLEEIAGRVAERYANDGFKRIEIPQSETMKKLTKEEEQYFVQKISDAVERQNGMIDTLTEMDIRAKIRGNVEAKEKMEDYVAKINELPKGEKDRFIENGIQIISDKNMIEISDYSNEVGLYKALSELGVDKAKKVIDTLMNSLERRKNTKSKEETPKIVDAKIDQKDEEER